MLSSGPTRARPDVDALSGPGALVEEPKSISRKFMLIPCSPEQEGVR